MGSGEQAHGRGATVRLALVLLVLTGLCLIVGACGGSAGTDPSSHVSSSTDPDDEVTTAANTKAAPPPDYAKLHHEDSDDETTTTSPNPEKIAATEYAKMDGDKDNDIGAAEDDTNNNLALNFGQAASTTDRSAITALVKRYYAIALAGNAIKGCSMLFSTLAEAAAEDYGVPGGPEYARGAKNCQQVLSGVFRFYHARLAAEVPKLSVTRVRLKGRQGYAILSFAPFPEREISVDREGHAWKIGAFVDNELP